MPKIVTGRLDFTFGCCEIDVYIHHGIYVLIEIHMQKLERWSETTPKLLDGGGDTQISRKRLVVRFVAVKISSLLVRWSTTTCALALANRPFVSQKKLKKEVRKAQCFLGR